MYPGLQKKRFHQPVDISIWGEVLSTCTYSIKSKLWHETSYIKCASKIVLDYADGHEGRRERMFLESLLCQKLQLLSH